MYYTPGITDYGRSRRIFVGIDPGAQTGLAVWCGLEQRFLELKTTNLIVAQYLLVQYAQIPGFRAVVVEDAALNEFVYERHLRQFGVRNLKALPEAELQKLLKIARNVGQNQRDCQIIQLWCGYHKIAYMPIKPSKDSPKWTPQQFLQLTRCQATTSQHSRDAAKLVFGL